VRNTHIEKGFLVLARELEFKDATLSHLRTEYDNERTLHEQSMKNVSVEQYLDYDDDNIILPLKENETKKAYAEYVKEWHNCVHMIRRDNKYNTAILIEKYNCAKDAFTRADPSYKNVIEYWVHMEEALFCLVDGDVAKASTEYRYATETWPRRYVPFFRLGQICLSSHNLIEALKNFDKCMVIMDSNQNKLPADKNRYYILLKLANVYWQQGSQFYPVVLNEINEAEKIFALDKGIFHHQDDTELHLLNNLCYYNCDYARYLREGSDMKKDNVENEHDKAIKKASECYIKIKEKIRDKKDNDIPCNEYDTLAIYCYYQYKLSNETSGASLEWLREAERNIDLAIKNVEHNRATGKVASRSLQMSHWLEIKSACRSNPYYPEK
jgi:hypothetical protein